MTAADVAGLLARLDEAHKAATPGPDSGKPVTDDERSSLRIDGLWTDEPYPEYSQAEVLRAYRLGAEDQRGQDANRRLILPQLVAAMRAVLDRHHRIGEGEPGAEVDYCDYDGFVWPCDEYRAVASALGAEVTGR